MFGLVCRAGSSVMAAYVEIVFDNSDGMLSITVFNPIKWTAA